MECPGVTPFVVVAIDFGTKYSGYAFSTSARFKEDPLRISGCTWTSRSTAEITLKTPTCVLFDPSTTFHSFGYEAENKYNELTEENNHENWYYFPRFTMQLYKSQEIPSDFQFEDGQGKLMSAIKVTAECFRYIREYCILQFNRKFTCIYPNEIKWVLTIPANLSDASKQFMKEAAVKGGIPNNQLTLVSEPIAALIYCYYVEIGKMGHPLLDCFSYGSRFLILEAGDSTIDLTVQEIQLNGSLKQLLMVEGGNLGWTKVEEAFEGVLQELFGASNFIRFREEHKSEYLDILHDFKIQGRRITSDYNGRVTIRIPVSLTLAYEEQKRVNSQVTVSNSSVIFRGDKIRIDPNSVRHFFSAPCNNITKLMQHILEKPSVKGTKTIVVVGGFSESPMLRDAVEKAFPNHRIIIPQNGELASLLGAVQFGFNPKIVPENNFGTSISLEGDMSVQDCSEKEIVDETEENSTEISLRNNNDVDTVDELGEKLSSDTSGSYHSLNDRFEFIDNNRVKFNEELTFLDNSNGSESGPSVESKNAEDKILVLQTQLDEEREQSTKLTLLNNRYKNRVEELEEELERNQQVDTYPSDVILHLGDKNRPHSLGNRFSDLFEHMWSSTDTLFKKHKPYNNDEGKRFEKTVDTIYNIAKVIDTICLKDSHEQLLKITNGLTTSLANPFDSKPKTKGVAHSPSEKIRRKAEEMAQEFRMSAAIDVIQVLQTEILDNEIKGKILRVPISEEWQACIYNCVELVWLMYIRQPSMELAWAKPGEAFNEEMFEFIGETQGKRVKLTVWPAVLLYKDGDLVAKGYSVSI